MPKTSMLMLLVPALLAVAGFTATGRAVRTAACEIRETRAPVGLEIDGVVHGRPGGTGVYQLELLKSGPSGDSDISQGGNFKIPAAGTTVVSASELNVSRGDVYRASMTLSNGAQCDRRMPAR